MGMVVLRGVQSERSNFMFSATRQQKLKLPTVGEQLSLLSRMALAPAVVIFLTGCQLSTSISKQKLTLKSLNRATASIQTPSAYVPVFGDTIHADLEFPDFSDEVYQFDVIAEQSIIGPVNAFAGCTMLGDQDRMCGAGLKFVWGKP